MTDTFHVDHIFDSCRPAVYAVFMALTQADVSRGRYQSRPGRLAVVAASLTDLRGPTGAAVELPIWLFWYPDRTFDLDEPGILPWMYQIVLREAGCAEDLAFLNGDRLMALWPELYLPKGVRQAWEDRHPELRQPAAASAA